jgi:glycosyltransferase involved in cell wall biosynthesis
MALKVCVLAKENVLHWIPFYTEAFRACCDVVTAGPGLDTEALKELDREATATLRVPNDIVTEETDALKIIEMLPEGWRPDLVVGVQSGSTAFENIARLACPTAYISVDTWHAPEQFEFALEYDSVFAAQKVFVPYFREYGSARAAWLPLACAPDHHFPAGLPEEFDIVFVGTTGYVVDEERVQRIIRLNREFNVARQEGVSAEEMSRTYSRGRLAFNSSIAQDVNMRVFEVLGMGRPLLTNRDAEVNGLFELFEDGVHLITYDDGDLTEKARYYLAHPEEREAIGRAGYEAALAHHTYRHRIESLLATVGAAFPETGAERKSLIRSGNRLSAWLPPAPGHVIDFGTGMNHSKLALRKMGCTRFTGVARDEESAGKRKRSYDEMLVWPAVPDLSEGAGTVCWTAPLTFCRSMEEVAALSHALLENGGSLILRISPGERGRMPGGGEISGLRPWFAERGFHLIVHEEAPPWTLLLLRRYSRALHDIVAEIYHRFPGGNLSAHNNRPGNSA